MQTQKDLRTFFLFKYHDEINHEETKAKWRNLAAAGQPGSTTTCGSEWCAGTSPRTSKSIEGADKVLSLFDWKFRQKLPHISDEDWEMKSHLQRTLEVLDSLCGILQDDEMRSEVRTALYDSTRQRGETVRQHEQRRKSSSTRQHSTRSQASHRCRGSHPRRRSRDLRISHRHSRGRRFAKLDRDEVAKPTDCRCQDR